MKQKYGRVVGDYNNTMMTTFGLNFYLCHAFKQHGYTIK